MSDESAILVRSDEHGRRALNGAGYLQLPAAYRHRCNLATRNQVFLVAVLDHELLVVVPTPLVAVALWHYRPGMWKVGNHER
ncbi:hypothetical protein [Nocardia terpenica]|uniref:Uncharacterized protein n=1 Tax=Nocardia terpenica TaxID=455432 RepID=A0A6G9ZCM8_9NOCA|nr:hypothetical protein [Nocardia terpenica]QIS23365.1 hypothetical protein F6W96_38550 [Nocardia terpenica]